jgi:23S rRNA (guanine2445-N2)-methyltransferase / 23S rRNA (guanine2069-N7)-methyltransferase
MVLVDPMCGSGTILLEAALMAMNVAPGLQRRVWPFEAWHDFHPEVWTKVSACVHVCRCVCV